MKEREREKEREEEKKMAGNERKTIRHSQEL